MTLRRVLRGGSALFGVPWESIPQYFFMFENVPANLKRLMALCCRNTDSFAFVLLLEAQAASGV